MDEPREVVCPCELKFAEDGHIEASCSTKEEARQLEDALQKEFVIRVKPKHVTVQ
jgi:hypothetical protein